MQWRKDLVWHDLFEAGVALKALNGVWESIGGILFVTVGSRWLAILSGRFALVNRYFSPISHSTQIFVSAYLLVHGIVNLFLAYYLFRNRLWAYPAAIAFTALVWVYEVYRVMHTHSIILLIVAIFDPIFIVLTIHEYFRQLRKRDRA